MKKKVLECAIHGLSLFRCKKRCWKGGSKDKPYTCIYTESCFKCLMEGRALATGQRQKHAKHVAIRVT